MDKKILILPRKMKLLLVILFVSLFFSCKKDNTALISSQPIQDTVTQKKDTLIDYSKLMVIQNLTALSSSIDSISISDTIYHAKYIVPINYQFTTDNRYYDVPTRSKCTVKFFVTIGNRYTPIEVYGFEPDGTVFESSEVLKFQGKDSATFNIPISNKTIVNLVHI